MGSKGNGRVFGEVTRELWELFGRHAGSLQVLGREQVRDALNEIEIYPTKSQVNELVHCACEGAGRTPVDHITFGEFAVLVAELREQYRKNSHDRPPISQCESKALLVLQERRKRRRLFDESAHFTVFLGGSCNPTTWRQDIAIPFLKKHAITFYNPQVPCWNPDLMELEDQAKQTAELLFFVIDNVTRSTASMVEAAYLAGCGRQLILVIKNFESPVVVAGETLREAEVEDLERSHAFLTDLVERQRIPVFEDIHTALRCTAKVVKQNMKVSDLEVKDGVKPVKCPHVRVADKFMKLKDAFHNMDTENSGKLSYQELCLAYRSITSEELPASLSAQSAQRTDNYYTFEEFCLVVAECKYRRKSLWRRAMGAMRQLPLITLDWVRGDLGPRELADNETRQRDVFLGGTCGPSSWRQDIAIPILRKKGLSYYNPQLSAWSTRYIPLEAAVKDNCRVLLYVITGDTRGVTSMLEVGHYIGQGCTIVLCLKQLPSNITIENEKLTDYAVKDYNRARAYLSDLANRDGIPIFDDVEEAVSCAAKLLRPHDS